LKRGDFIKDTSQKRSINFPADTLKTLDKLAAKNHTTTSELVRQYVDKGLEIDGHRENIDFIAQIIRQELTAIYNIDDIKNVTDRNTDRLAKMLMKIGKINGAMFFLLVKVLVNLANDGSDDRFDQMLTEAVALGVDYMQKKDFQINSFLQDTDHLRELSKNL
jgi:hypothetical protein